MLEIVLKQEGIQKSRFMRERYLEKYNMNILCISIHKITPVSKLFCNLYKQKQKKKQRIGHSVDWVCRYQHGEVLFEHDYSIKLWSSGCYFYDTGLSDWDTAGCTVRPGE